MRIIKSDNYKKIEKKANQTVDLYARYVGDGYLAYAEYADQGRDDDNYWPDYYDSDHDSSESETVLLRGVPIDLAEKLVAQGSSNQWFSDGYEAASAAAPYVEREDDEGNGDDYRPNIPDTPVGMEDDNPVNGIDY